MLGEEGAQRFAIRDDRAVDPAIAPCAVGNSVRARPPDYFRRGFDFEPAHDEMDIGLLIAARALGQPDGSLRIAAHELVEDRRNGVVIRAAE